LYQENYLINHFNLFTMSNQVQPRAIYEIAAEIRKTWRPVHEWAKPYVEAMECLNSPNDMFGADSAKEIVLRFLGNAQMWRGEDARRIKAELKKMFGVK